MLCGHAVPFSETWPTSGMWDASGLYPLPTPEHRIAGSECSSSPGLLKTPTAQLAINGGSQHPDKRRAGGHGPTLADQVEHLLPTPVSADGERQSTGYARGNPTLAGALLPTPAAHDSGNSPESHLSKKPGRSQVTSLQVIAEHGLIETGGRLLPTPTAMDSHGARNATARRSELKKGVNNDGWTLSDVFWTGDLTSPPSGDGKPS